MHKHLIVYWFALLLLGLSCYLTGIASAQPVAPQAAKKIYLPLVGGSGDAPAPAPQPTPVPQPSPTPPPSGSMPASLARQWFTGNLTTISFYDRNSGTWSQPNGLGESYTFAANGSYTYGAALKIQNGACVSEATVYQTGVARAGDSELELEATFSRTRTRVVCGSVSESVSEALPALKRITYRVAVGTEGHTELTLGTGESTRTFALLGVDAQLLGAWQQGGISSQGFYDPAIGRWAQPTAPGEWYRFSADGRFTYGLYTEQQDEQGCAIRFWTHQEGEFSMSGGRLSTRFTAGRGRLENSCTPDDVQDKPFVGTKPGEYAWQILSDGGVPQLRLLRLMPFGSQTYTKE